MALDWFTGLIGYDASGLRVGRVLSVGPWGDIEWDRDRWEKVRGSYEATVQVTREGATEAMRSCGFACAQEVLKVSGNPTKFLQGHNVFGPSVEEAGAVLRAMVRAFPDGVRPADSDDEALRAVHRSRYDVVVHVDLGAHRLVHEWLGAAATMTRSRHGRALVSGSTVYWGQHSTRWTMKAYCKFCELKAHPALEMQDELRAWCESHLRLELTLRRKELKDRGALTEDVVWEFYEKLTTGVSEMEVTPDVVNGLALSIACKMTLRRWLDGVDVRYEVPRATFYYYRRLILEALGVDISLKRDKYWGELDRLGFDVAYLKARQVKKVDQGLQRVLLKV
jgi:hypothetical protein